MVERVKLDKFTHLAMVAHALTGDLEADEMLQLVMHQGMAGMGATGASVAFLQGASIYFAAAAGTTRESLERLGPIGIDGPNPAGLAISADEPVWLSTREEGLRRFPDLRLSSSMSQGWAVVPLRSRARPFGALSLSFPSPPTFDTESRSFILALGNVTSLALLTVFDRPGYSPRSLYLSLLVDQLLAEPDDAVVIVDSDGVILGVNEQLTDLLGHSRVELIGRSVEVLLPFGAREEHARLRRRYVEDPVPRPLGSGLDTVARHRDGTDVPVGISLSPVTTPLGTCVVAVLRV